MSWSDAFSALGLAIIVLLGLWVSNVLLDRGVPQYLSRKVGHAAGGLAYFLTPLLFQGPLIPILVSLSFVALLGGARLVRPRTFRGVGGTGRPHAWAEVNFPLAGTASLILGWGILGDPWLGAVPGVMMGWGDMITGLVRHRVYGREVKGLWGSLAMLLVCLLLALLITPYWVGAVGAVVATAAEKLTPTRRFLDDNLTIPLAAVVAMGIVRLWR